MPNVPKRKRIGWGSGRRPGFHLTEAQKRRISELAKKKAFSSKKLLDVRRANLNVQIRNFRMTRKQATAELAAYRKELENRTRSQSGTD